MICAGLAPLEHIPPAPDGLGEAIQASPSTELPGKDTQANRWARHTSRGATYLANDCRGGSIGRKAAISSRFQKILVKCVICFAQCHHAKYILFLSNQHSQAALSELKTFCFGLLFHCLFTIIKYNFFSTTRYMISSKHIISN